MKTLSILLASAVMIVGLSVSSHASAELDAHEILSEGEILMKHRETTFHEFTVAYDGKIYRCWTSGHASNSHVACRKLPDKSSTYPGR